MRIASFALKAPRQCSPRIKQARRGACRFTTWERTLPHAVQHEGWIRLEPFEGGTRVHLRMSYSPPGGAAGHVIAKLFGADPKSDLDQDLMRLKSVLEGGKMPRDAAVPD